jgi:hypothetical protein
VIGYVTNWTGVLMLLYPVHFKGVPAYLNNLERLGLIWFSREPLPDPIATRCSRPSPR